MEIPIRKTREFIEFGYNSDSDTVPAENFRLLKSSESKATIRIDASKNLREKIKSNFGEDFRHFEEYRHRDLKSVIIRNEKFGEIIQKWLYNWQIDESAKASLIIEGSKDHIFNLSNGFIFDTNSVVERSRYATERDSRHFSRFFVLFFDHSDNCWQQRFLIT